MTVIVIAVGVSSCQSTVPVIVSAWSAPVPVSVSWTPAIGKAVIGGSSEVTSPIAGTSVPMALKVSSPSEICAWRVCWMSARAIGCSYRQRFRLRIRAGVVPIGGS